MIEITIYRYRTDKSEEVARVTIDGEIKGETPTAEGLRERLSNDLRLDRYTDGRDLLRYIRTSYTTGYLFAVYDSKESEQIVEDLSDEAYESWRKTTEYETQL